MRITEIEENPAAHEFAMSDFEVAVFGTSAKTVHTSGATKTGVPWTLVKAEGSYDTYGVLENGEIIGAVLVVDGHLGRQIDLVATRSDRRNHGVIRFVIDWIVDHEGPVYSSASQTKKAREMWQALIILPARRRFFAIDPKSMTKTLLNKKNLDLPWEDPATVILVESETPCAIVEQMRAAQVWVRPLYGAGNDTVGNP